MSVNSGRIRVTPSAGAPSAYDVLIGAGILGDLPGRFDLKPYSKIAVLVDERLETTAGAAISRSLDGIVQYRVLPLTMRERDKDIDRCADLWRWLLLNGFDRHTLVINIGGGVLGDLGGFVASTFMRGIPFLQVPTTLLAQVDASIGGKVGVNFDGKKNILGTITPPVGVMIDVLTLGTLPRRELIAGFAEIVKHALLTGDEAYLNEAVELAGTVYPVAGFPPELADRFIALIARSVEIKREIVDEDPFELGARKLLNLGHTIGHAVESAALSQEVSLLHGEAVAIGLVWEAELALACGRVSPSYVQRIREVLTTIGLPVECPAELAANPERLRETILKDKKNRGGIIRFALPREPGIPEFDVSTLDSDLDTVLRRLCGK